jgi:L-2,4-diaminobutyric acid acetyltransferase
MATMSALDLRPPSIADGAAIARLADRAGSLDVNSSYAYVLWCRDFAATSIVAEASSELVGFITAYLRPDERSTLFVWQVAVDGGQRGAGVASAMLDELARRVGPRFVEATVTPGNEASHRLFETFARRRAVGLQRSPLFGEGDFGESHDPEELVRIGPLN